MHVKLYIEGHTFDRFGYRPSPVLFQQRHSKRRRCLWFGEFLDVALEHQNLPRSPQHSQLAAYMFALIFSNNIIHRSFEKQCENTSEGNLLIFTEP